MVQPSRLSDPPEEEAFLGAPAPEDAPLDERALLDEHETAPASRGADALSGDGGARHAPIDGGRGSGEGGGDRARLLGLGAIGALVAVGLGLIVASPRRGGDVATPSLSLTSAGVAANTNAGGKGAPAEAASAPAGAALVRPPPAWRVSSLAGDAGVELSEGSFGKRGLVATLGQAGLPRAEIRRLAQAFEGVRRLDRPRESDTFVLARDKSKGTLLAFEYATSPVDVWQARVDGGDAEGRITVKKLELFVERRRLAHGFVVNADLSTSISAAGMRPEIALAVDDALEGHVEPGSIRPGARMRVAAAEEWVEGAFARVKVEAIEFVPKAGSPLRVYYYERDPREGLGSARRAPAPGFYDAKARQPFHGQFRSPLALARVTSRFNPKRLHPVLKTVMPHQGVDFGASTGTPVYASAAGTVVNARNSGPCGNMVEIDHGGGIHTAYCHLKGFAAGLRAGQKVEQRQLVGYVGQTGRVTGPHLHFVVKKNGVFVDPLGLKMDGVRVLPPADRDSFARKRADLDALIDGVALPSAADVPDESDDKDLHAD
ncbi:MAG: M23 family metallopeptidase [Labilithrix sp.]|nr:M23 family metallopeptidase [Labilithrix sp.]